MSDQEKLEILIDVRSRLEDLVKSQQEFRKLREEASGFGNMLKTGLGIDVARRGLDLLTSSIKNSVFESFRLADSIQDGAANLEISQEAYQVLGEIIKDAGGDISQLTMAVSTNNRSMVEARDQSSSAAAAYRQLGLDASALEQLTVEQRFEVIGRAVANARDKTAAFAAASQILGSRNLPTLLGALKDLADDGYTNAAAKMKAAGRVMEDETINILAKAQKQVENFQNTTLPIAAGTAIGWIQSGMDRIGATVANIINVASGLSWISNLPDDLKKNKKNEQDGADTTPLQQTATWKETVLGLTKNQNAQALIEGDNLKSEIEKKAELLPLLNEEIRARGILVDLANSSKVTATFTKDEKDALIEKLQHDYDLIAQKKENKFTQIDALTSRKNRPGWNDPENARANENYLSMGDGLKAGAGDWVTNLGSRGEQVASALQSTLGSVVSGISDGIYGWVTGTESFGSALAQLGGTILRTILQSIVQIGVQMLVNAILSRTLAAASATANLALAAATATPLAMIWAAPATLATIASFGGAAAQAPLSIGAAMLSTLAISAAGFLAGGYTGDMPTNAVAGVVHGQEHVMTAATTRRLGPAFFDHLNAGGSPATASVASASMAFGGQGMAAAGGRESTRNTYLLMDRDSFSRAMQEDSTGYFREIAAGMMRA